MDRLSIALSVFSLILILIVLRSVRRAHIRVEYSVSWLGAALMLLVLSASSTLLERLASLLGVNNPPMALLMLVLLVFLFVFYRFSVIVSNLKDANIALTQRLAILEYQLRSDHGSHQA